MKHNYDYKFIHRQPRNNRNVIFKDGISKDALPTESLMEKEIPEEMPQGSEVDTDVCKDNTKSLAKQSSTDSVSSDSQSASSPSKFSYFYQGRQSCRLLKIKVKRLIFIISEYNLMLSVTDLPNNVILIDFQPRMGSTLIFTWLM
jgi:hypothetical protein